jgi:hypothetical protein
MNSVEQMQGELAALSKRVIELEKAAQQRMEGNPDQLKAQRVAEEIGFSVNVIMLPMRGKERKKVARELKARKWSLSRIARALNCCERTVERWTS